MTLEELLNKLIKKGWKPFGGKYYDRFIIESNGDMCFKWKLPGTDGTNSYDYNYDYFKIRELASIDSGLWQFVCENKMQKEDDGHITRIINLYKSDESIVDGGWDYHYWLMICSILDESDLEKFLLENIKIS